MSNLSEKREENLPHTAINAKQLTFTNNDKGQLENVKNGGKIVVMWSLLPFALHINALLTLLNVGFGKVLRTTIYANYEKNLKETLAKYNIVLLAFLEVEITQR